MQDLETAHIVHHVLQQVAPVGPRRNGEGDMGAFPDQFRLTHFWTAQGEGKSAALLGQDVPSSTFD